jgi:hypothetical protein
MSTTTLIIGEDDGRCHFSYYFDAKYSTRCCDARIESILLDVNEKKIIGSLW